MIFSVKNKDLTIGREINKALLGDVLDEIHHNIPAVVVSSFKYVPMTSVDVERSFSIYKHSLTDRREKKSLNTI